MAGKLSPVGFLGRRPHFYGRDGSRLGCYFLSMDMRKMNHCLVATCDELMKKMNLSDFNWQFFISTITSFLSKIAPKTKKRWCVYTVIVVIICVSCLFIQDKTANQIVTEPPTSTLTSTTTPTSSTAASTAL